MFASSTQPNLVSLFSSTGSDPLQLFSAHTDPALPSDSFIHLLHDSSSRPEPPPPATIIRLPSLDPNAVETHADEDDDPDNPGYGYCLDQTVLHIQSPTLRTTFIRCPPCIDTASPGRGVNANDGRGKQRHLGMKHPWVNLQVRNLGREWSFELGLVDQLGRQGVVRCSTFQRQPRLKLPAHRHSLPLLHLPLAFPPPSSHPLTPWSTISLHLPPLLPQFSSLALTASDNDREDDDAEEEDDASRRRGGRALSGANVVLPSGVYSHVSYVKVYATCRLRRIWFSESDPQKNVPWEFQLYSTD